jgi:photosystem II stability/assembly factor-like uncharacterized protein
MRKILLLLFFTTFYWQINAQTCDLKITSSVAKPCEGQTINLTASGDIPYYLSLQWNKNDESIFNAANTTYQTNQTGVYKVSTLGEGVWNLKTPNTFDVGFRKVQFINSTIGWTLNYYGQLKKTIDGGLNWTEQAFNSDGGIRDIYFLDAKNGFACGERFDGNKYIYSLLRTPDGGVNWLPVNIPSDNSNPYNQTLDRISFNNQKVGHISSDNSSIIYTTNDGGITWSYQKSSSFYPSLFNATFIDETSAIVIAGDKALAKTIDNGKTWKFVLFSDNVIKNIYFQNSKVGWASGEGILYNSIDGGENWIKKTVIDGTINLINIFFTDNKTGFAYSDSPKYYKTIDGGISWALQSSDVRFKLNSASYIDNNIGWLVGDNGIVLKTIDGGKTLQKLIKGNPNIYYDIHFGDIKTGYRVGWAGLIEKTVDAGNTWIEQKSNTLDNLKDVHFVDNNIGWITNYASSSILKTIDGGNTWSTQNLKIMKLPKAVHFFDKNEGIVVGANNLILKTSDGGTTWNLPRHTWDTLTGYDKTLNALHFSDSQNGWAVGNTIILKTVDKGTTWTEVKINFNITDSYTSVFFVDNLFGCITGNKNIYITSDGGKTWSLSGNIRNSYNTFNSVRFINSKVGWVSAFRNILTTFDGGKNWYVENTKVNNIINSIYVLNANSVWAVGEIETMFKYEKPVICTSNTITINPKPAIPTLAWNNSDGKLTATTATTSPQLTWLKGVDELKNITAATYQPTSSGSYSVRVTDGNGCTEISKAVDITILASDNPLNDLGVSVYPNPSNNGIFKVAFTRFSNEMEATMQVIGLDGLPLNSQKMIRQNNAFEGEINASNLATGIYLLQIVSGEQKAVVKISIAK